MIIIYKDLITKYIDYFKPTHIINYCIKNNINISNEEVNIVYDFIINNYKDILDNEDSLLKLKPLISNNLYNDILLEYKKNKAKYF